MKSIAAGNVHPFRTGTMVVLTICGVGLLAFLIVLGINIGSIVRMNGLLGRIGFPQDGGGIDAELAVKRLGGCTGATGHLSRYLRLPTWLATRKTLAVSLLGHCGESAIETLVGTLRNENAQLRAAAAWALGEMEAQKGVAIPALAEALGDPDLGVGSCAAWALGQIGQEAVPALLEALKNPKASVRRNAAIALGKIGPTANAGLTALERCLEDTDKGVRLAAAEAVWLISGDAGKAVPELVSALESQSEVLRWEAAVFLGRMGPKAKAAIPSLEKAMKSNNSDLCAAAAGALRGIRGWAYPEEKPKDENAPDPAPKTPVGPKPQGVEEPGQDAP